jgi:xanthine dehydrogenase accessory factor
MISAIVLAAGQAARFGQCKQLMRLGEKTLLEHVLDSLRQSRVEDVVVVLGAHADEIQQQIVFGRERVIINPGYTKGMSTSIQAGLNALPATTEAAMIVLADQPFVAPSTLDLLIDEYRRTQPSVVIPTYHGFRGNPVLVDKSLFPEMMGIRGDIGCRAIFGEHAERIAKVPVDDRGVVTDIDTMEDFDRARAATTPPAEGPPSDDLLETVVGLRRRRQPFAIATVVRAERPTSSKPGDKAIIAPDGTLTGWIGGSCAHDIVVRNALEALEEGAPRFLTLSSASPADAKRQGVIDVPMQCYSGGVLDVFIEPNLPKAQLVVVGYETVARALARIGKTVSFHVTVVDPLATRASAPEADEIVNELKLGDLPLGGESFIVIATHGRYDEEALEQAARTSASYIALVSSPKRAGEILRQLRERGVSEDALARIKAPAGLDIGAEGAEEIALSIVAEIVQERRSGRLRRPAAAPAAEVPAEAIDPICNMSVTIAGALHSAEHEGQRYYFCCAHCQRTFEQDPHRYAHVA